MPWAWLNACIPDYPVTEAPPPPPPCPEPCAIADLATDLWYGEEAEAWAGDTLAALGTLDGPPGTFGYVVGAKHALDGAGKAYVVIDQDAPPPGRSLGEARVAFVYGAPEGDGAGARLGVTAEGLVDPATGAHQAVALGAHLSVNRKGTVWIVTGALGEPGQVTEIDLTQALAAGTEGGGPAVARWRGSTTGIAAETEAGVSLDAGDLDGDGRMDLAVGSYAGAWVLRDVVGSAGEHLLAQDAWISLCTSGAAAQTGCAVELAEGFDGTGDPVLAVGSCLADGTSQGTTATAALDRGAVALVSARDLVSGGKFPLNTVFERMWLGEPDDHLGVELEDAGDLDGDGFTDLLVEAHSCGAQGLDCADYGSARWWVVGGGGPTTASGTVAPLAGEAWTVEIRMEATHKSCDSGIAGTFAGDPSTRDVALSWCPGSEFGSVLLIADLCDHVACGASVLDLPTDLDADGLVVIDGGAGPNALVGAELSQVDGRVLVGGWKWSPGGGASLSDAPLTHAGAAYVLDLPSLGM